MSAFQIKRQTAGQASGRAFVVNEAHGLRQDKIRQLLVLLERLPDHVLLVFTTTKDGQDKGTSLRRIAEELQTQGLTNRNGKRL